MMTTMQQVMTIGVVCLGTIFTRFIAFILFPQGRKTPEYVQYLGKVLPAAIFGMLVIYCYKDINFSSVNNYLPAIIAGIAVVVIQKLKKSMLLSIVVGTAVYMILIRIIV